jgi:hypothetical protein
VPHTPRLKRSSHISLRLYHICLSCDDVGTEASQPNFELQEARSKIHPLASCFSSRFADELHKTVFFFTCVYKSRCPTCEFIHTCPVKRIEYSPIYSSYPPTGAPQLTEQCLGREERCPAYLLLTQSWAHRATTLMELTQNAPRKGCHPQRLYANPWQ